MSAATKTVIIVAEDLPAGLAANTAAVLALTLGRDAAPLVGPAVPDKSGLEHPGITTVPLPVLSTSSDTLVALHRTARGDELLVAAFSDVAQRTRSYEEYTAKLADTPTERLKFLGLALHGPRDRVQSLTGSLPLFR